MEPLKQWLQPIRLWLKIFGIYLQENETKHGRKDFSMLSVANTLFWIILNFGSNALDGILLKAGSSNPNEEALETHRVEHEEAARSALLRHFPR